MFDELVKVLRGCVLSKPCEGCPYYDPNGPTEKCATLNIAAADAIEELTGFVQEAERDRDEYRDRLDKANEAIEFLQTYKVAFENIISMGGWWLVGQDKNLHRMNVPMNWPPKGTKTVEVFPLPAPPTAEEDE